MQLLYKLLQDNINILIYELITKNNMGLIFLYQSKFNMIVEIFQKLSDRFIVSCLSNILFIKFNLVLALYYQDKYNKALSILKNIYNIQKNILRTNDYEILNTYNSITNIILMQ